MPSHKELNPTNVLGPKQKFSIPKGRPKSGRVWKADAFPKFDIINVKSLHSKWSKRQADRSEKKSVKEMETSMKDAKKQAKIDKRQRTVEQQQRREENAKKSEVVQVITNTRKIKRMKKKQLRKIEKR